MVNQLVPPSQNSIVKGKNYMGYLNKLIKGKDFRETKF